MTFPSKIKSHIVTHIKPKITSHIKSNIISHIKTKITSHIKTKNLIAPSSSILLIRQSIVEIPLGRLQRRTWARWRWCWRNPSAWSCWRNPYCAAYAAAAWRRVRADYRARNSRHTRHGPLSSGTNHPNTLYVLGFDCAKCSVLGEGGCNCINKEVSCCFHVPFFFSFRYPLVPVYKNQRGHENNKTPLYQCSCKRVFFLALTMCRFYLMCYLMCYLMSYLMSFLMSFLLSSLMRCNTDTLSLLNWQWQITVGCVQWRQCGAV